MFPVTETLYEGVFPSGQRGQTVNLLHLCFGGPNPPAPTNKKASDEVRCFFVVFLEQDEQ